MTPNNKINIQPKTAADYTQSHEEITFERIDERIEKKLAEATAETLDKAKSEIEKQIQIAQASFITVFGIFASITSFLTIEFQFLKGLTNINQVIGFTLVLSGSLFLFNIALNNLVKNQLMGNSKSDLWFPVITFVLLISGIAFILLGNNSVKY